MSEHLHKKAMIIGGPASSFAGRNVASSSTTAASISSNFEELQRELQAFNELFGLWTEQRRRALLEDKDAYLKTLSEEHGTIICRVIGSNLCGF